jgi:aryl-alcohol dehydrogenase-like predicted oxidoreductase
VSKSDGHAGGRSVGSGDVQQRTLRVVQPSHTALGTWSGGRYMRFGLQLDEERLAALLRPGDGIDTVITADAYGAGEADALLGRALRGVPREAYSLVGAIGHDIYDGQRRGSKGYARFTDPELRGPDEYAAYVVRATEASLQRIGADAFDVLLLHNPDRTGYTSPEVWEGMAEVRRRGLAHALGIAPGPANGFTLDVIDCLERFGELIDWAMVILNPMEPWPGRLVLPAARRHGVQLIARVVDYGGLFWDDVAPGHAFAEHDHRLFRPEGWIDAGRARMERMRPIAERHGLTPLQLSCAWDLAQEPVRCVAPTLIEEPGASKPIEAKRAELAAVPREVVLTPEEVEELAAIGDNMGSMALKGASPDFDGPAQPDRWPLDDELEQLAARWEIDPARDLAESVGRAS